MAAASTPKYSASEWIKHLIAIMPKVISEGQEIPDIKIPCNKAELLSTARYLEGKLVVLLAVPKAFTPTCTMTHLPGFLSLTATLRKLGVERIVCVAVNTLEEMQAWFKVLQESTKVTKAASSDPKPSEEPGLEIEMLADPAGEFIWHLGLGIDKYDPRGLGFISRRAVIVLQNRVVKKVLLEPDETPGQCVSTSGAETVKAVTELVQGSLEGSPLVRGSFEEHKKS